jgi:uncharacterized protein YbcV (DUF1398 family)
MSKTLPKTKFDELLDGMIKAGVIAWVVKVVLRSDRV